MLSAGIFKVMAAPENQGMKKPVVDIGGCSRCEGCIQVCPSVFYMNDMGYIDVAELADYPEAEVDEAIKYCPEDCICWDSEEHCA
ncbi:MAG: ferredoxin [Deltaproteobacteria bacterium]|jgi:ferredoxin